MPVSIRYPAQAGTIAWGRVVTHYRRKVLVIDDNHDALQTLSDILQMFQVGCVCASSAEEALGKFDAEDIGLVITDVRMPKVSGIDLLVFLKEKTPDLPVVLTSAYHLSPDEEQVAAAQADRFLAKPYRISELVAIIEQYLGPELKSATPALASRPEQTADRHSPAGESFHPDR
jgi:DNA-binding NtrC family response regulator